VLTSPADPAVRPRAGHRDLARRTARFSGAAALAAGAVILAVSGIGYLGSAIVGGAVRALVLLLDAGVWVTVALQEGVDWWSIAGRASAVVGETLLTSRVMSGLIALELVGAAAFYLLQRLLKDEERGRDSSKEPS
jgi:hypothetical protein